MSAAGRGLLLLMLCAGTAWADGVVLPASDRVVLDNGVVLILNEKHDVPLIGMEAVLRGGAVVDPPAKNGLASLFASLIEKGAGERSSAEFAEAIDAVGGKLSASADIESINISGDFLARDASLMVELLADMLLRPALRRDELDKLRDRAINFIRAAKDSAPGRLMPIYGGAFLFGDHPYGNAVAGSETSLKNISHADLHSYYERQVGADRLIVVVSGDFDAAKMRQRLSAAFGEWRSASQPVTRVIAPPRQEGGRVLLIDKPGATQSYFWIGRVGVSQSYPHRADLDLANTVFGGRFTSMLNAALRVESGLTYGAGSRLSQHSQPGYVVISSYTRTDATLEAIDMALGVLGQLHDTGVDAAMIDSGRNYVMGQFPMAFETAAQLAAMFAFLEAGGFDSSYIDDYGDAIAAVNGESIAAIIAEVYPQQDELVFVVLGDAELIRESLSKYGSVTELAITAPRFRP